GIDGLAAAEAAFIAYAGATLGLASGHAAEVSAVAFAFGATCSGFLLWNWAPAKVFMGDVGSGYMGYVIVVLALGAARENPVALWEIGRASCRERGEIGERCALRKLRAARVAE